MPKSFLIKNKMIKPIGMEQKSGRGYGILPIRTLKKSISKVIGRGELLLSSNLGTTNIGGNGFGVKSNNPNLIQKLGNLSLGNKARKNVRLII